MEQLGAAAFAVSIIGGVHDLLTKKIPNWITFPAMFMGLLAQVWFFGFDGALQAAGGILLGFLLYFPIYSLGHMGAGDVKLLMAMGAWIGWRACFQVAVWAVIIGAVYALFEVIYRGRLWVVGKNTYSFLRALFVPGLVVEKLRLDRDRKFAFGICLALALAGKIFFQNGGKLPL